MTSASRTLSLTIPIYRNEASLPRLLTALEALAARLDSRLEVVFVVDGSPDASLRILQERLPGWSVPSQLVELSRNFGSFAAIAAGLQVGHGDAFAVLTADLQEPPELVIEFDRRLARGDADVVFAHRTSRADPWSSRWTSQLFWRLYRRFVVPDIPKGGIDVFACTRDVRDRLLQLKEVNTNLIALLFWLGYRRVFVAYERQPRKEGRSSWTFGRKLRYALDSIFSFTDLPLRLLMILGTAGTLLAAIAALIVFTGWWLGRIPVLGYVPLMLAITFFGGLTALGLGIVGQYQWLTLQNSRGRPPFVIKSTWAFDSGEGNPPPA